MEHISLDEISSDEDTKRKYCKTSSKKNGDLSSAAGQIKTEKPAAEKKEYSVLELLELQARARAIRSQLALEPVTKIELDGDEEEIPPVKDKNTEKKKVRKSSPGSHKKRDSTSEKKGSNSKASLSKPFNGSSSSSKAETNKCPLIIVPETPATDDGLSRVVKVTNCYRKHQLGATEEINVEVKNDRLQRRKENSRESSPEVTPIVASPVTLCISSDDDSGAAAAKNGTTVNAENENAEKVKPDDEPEPEDGEIDEESQDAKQGDESAAPKDCVGETLAISCSKDVSESQTDSKYDSDVLCVQLEDDCIELECDDPIEEGDNEESCAKEIGAAAVEIVDSSADEEIDTEKDGASSYSKSWGVRWLESSKVTKILATSKLGNQVRRKIQLSKKGIKQQEGTPGIEIVQAPNEVKENAQRDVVEESEVGSIEHYRKIVDKANTKEE